MKHMRIEEFRISNYIMYEKTTHIIESINKDFIPDIWIEMNPAHLHQILWNLVLNAAEAIEDQGVIDIGMHPSKDNTVEIRISDNGCGMSREIINSIFDPFFTKMHELSPPNLKFTRRGRGCAI